ncbi:MAG: hypothetical protein ACJ8AT_23535 [Hyalangium sp.]|uniref:hypothetical protein n=1 Tax=Hyalangium sp. TaxID=2028555 RepID=UPI00389A2D3F
MHLENSRDRGRLRAPHVWALVTGCLWGATSLMACGTLRPEPCTTLHDDVLEELRTEDGTERHVLDPWACEHNARRLHELAEELRALEIRDASLHEAVEAYRAKVERLSEDYGRLAAAYQDSAGLPSEEAQRVRTTLSRRVLEDSASMNAPRIQVQHSCDL